MRYPIRPVFAVFAALFFMCAVSGCIFEGNSPSGPGTGELSGVVKDPEAGLPGVVIRVTSAGADFTAVTDSSGIFGLKDIEPGTYTVMPVSIGYRFEPPSREVSVGKGATALPAFIAIREEPGSPVIIEGIRLIPIPAGSFLMGSDTGHGNEQPVHEVDVDALYACATEITQGQYQALVHWNPSYYAGLAKPVDQVSWRDAAQFCNLLSDKAGFERCYDETTWECDLSKNGFRLPTEAEWEYLCRAGTTTDYNLGGEDSLPLAAWYAPTADNTSQPCGTLTANAWGLFDMHGNLWEWCNDRYYELYYRTSPKANPAGPSEGNFRVIRGGSWFSSPDECRSSFRGYGLPDFRYHRIGFRVVKRS